MTAWTIWGIGIMFTMTLTLPNKWDNSIHPTGILACVFLWPIVLGTWLRRNHYNIAN